MDNNTKNNLLAKVGSSLQNLTDKFDSAGNSQAIPPNTINQNTLPYEINSQQGQNPNAIPQININISNVNSANAINAGAFYSTKSRFAALLLCIFLGFFGVHRFYLGKPFTGILYLFTSGLFLVGWAWDCAMLVMNNAKDGNGLPFR